MKNARIFLGGLSLILLGGMWSLPSQAGATSISFSSFSLVDTVSTNLGQTGTSHSFSEGPVLSPLTDTLSQSTLVPTGINSHGGVAYTTSNSSIQVSIAPAEDRPSQDPGGVERDINTVVTPGIFITQTVGYIPPKGNNIFQNNDVTAFANSKFSGNFTGTGKIVNFDVMNYYTHVNVFNTGSIGGDNNFDSNLGLTVTNLTTHSIVAYLQADSTNPTGILSSLFPNTLNPNNPAGNTFPGPPILVEFSTVPGDLYNLNFDLFSLINSGAPGSLAANITTSFVANTPEPSTILLLLTGLGIVLFGGMRHRIGKDIRIN
ncbi:MAG: PEP-CTERM sorting domain-containing protein [Leptospirales bacterium]